MTIPSLTTHALTALGVQPEQLEALRHLPHAEAVKLLDALKDKVRRNWRRAVFDLHPDRTGGDPQKTALFHELTRIKEAFENFLPPSPPPRPPRPVYVYEYDAQQAPHSPATIFQGTHRPRTTNPSPIGHRTATMKP